MTALYTTALAVGHDRGRRPDRPGRRPRGRLAVRSRLVGGAQRARRAAVADDAAARRRGTGRAGTASAPVELRAQPHRLGTDGLLRRAVVPGLHRLRLVRGLPARPRPQQERRRATSSRVMAGLSIPVSMIAPTIPPRRHRALVGVLGLAYLVAYLGLAIAPNGGAVAWMVLAGIGSGMFPLALTLIGLRARTSATTGVLSAFVAVDRLHRRRHRAVAVRRAARRRGRLGTAAGAAVRRPRRLPLVTGWLASRPTLRGRRGRRPRRRYGRLTAWPGTGWNPRTRPSSTPRPSSIASPSGWTSPPEQVWESLASDESIAAWPMGPGIRIGLRWTSPRPFGIGTTREVRLPLRRHDRA